MKHTMNIIILMQQIQHLFKIKLIILRNSEPFYSLLWAKMFSFYLLPSKLKPEATEEEKAKDLSIRKSKIARGTRLALDYKEEDLINKSFRFPKHQMLNPNNPPNYVCFNRT
jgi:hypothetical protein